MLHSVSSRVFGVVIGGLLLCQMGATAESESTMTIQTQLKSATSLRSDLLKNTKTTRITIAHDPNYKTEMTFDAIPASELFQGLQVSADATIKFVCTDGYSAVSSAPQLLNKDPSKAVAYIAIEDPAHPWPNLPGKDKSAGPYYLIWDNPKLSDIGPGAWAYMLKGFNVELPLKQLHPGIFPDEALAESDPVQRGFKIFTKTCFSCHSLNLEGEVTEVKEGQVRGPDLNVPNSVVENWNESSLRKLIRNPKSVRRWPQSKMSAFPESAISDQDIDDLLAYLRHMSERKVELPAE